MVTRCPLHDSAVCLITQLGELLRRRGAVTIELADLGGDMGGVRFTDTTILLDYRLTDAERRATLGHEVTHLLRGRPAPGDEALDELEVRERTALELVPEARRLRRLGRRWTDQEIRALAERYGVDDATMYDAIRPVVPATREPSDGRDAARTR